MNSHLELKVFFEAPMFQLRLFKLQNDWILIAVDLHLSHSNVEIRTLLHLPLFTARYRQRLHYYHIFRPLYSIWYHT